MKGRYPLVWWKVQCYECGGLGHRRRDHGEMKKMKKDKIETKKEDKKKNKKEKKTKKSEKKKIERREIGIETEREEIVVEKREKKNVEILTEVEEIVEDKREIELREREEKVYTREKEI